MDAEEKWYAPFLNWELWVFPIILTFFLLILVQYSFLGFHTLAEIFAIVISFIMFSLAWTTYEFSKKPFLIFLACGYFWVGSLDLIHTLVYKDMNVFVEGSGNLSVQFWISARYAEALLLLTAPLVGKREQNRNIFFILFGMIFLVIVTLIFMGQFPIVFVEGKGLTDFKIYSEYLIILILLLAIVTLYRFGKEISTAEKKLITLAIVLTIGAEFIFTFYVSIFGISIIAGHILKLFSFWVIFQAIIKTNLKKPYLDLNANYQLIIAGREKLENEIRERQKHEKALSDANRSLDALSRVNSVLIHAVTEKELLIEICKIIVEIGGYRLAWVGFAENDEEKTVRPVGHYGVSDGYLNNVLITWADTERGQWPSGRAIRSGKPVYSNNILNDSQLTLWHEAVKNLGFASSIALPLLEGDKAFGALSICSSETDAFYENDIQLLTDLANNLSFGILSLRKTIAHQTAEEQIQIQQEQLIQANKLVSLGTLVSGVAHEINNPNAIITLNTPSLKKFWEDVLPILDEHRESKGDFTLGSIPYDRVRNDIPAMLDDIQGGTDRIKVIVENLKNFARQGDSGERNAISLNKVVESAVVLLGAKIRKATNHFIFTLVKDLPAVEANFQELEQVVINLITNACDALASPEDSITISTTFDAESQQVKISVADEGEGIAQENMSRIKDPFFTTKRESGGTGLGLSVSHGIIENHNGSLEFSSPPEGGTIATIALSVQIS